MIKIGTITFHWATNYGAVMQSFALQKALLDLDVQTEIINYIPNDSIRKSNVKNFFRCDFNTLKKELRINKFRKKLCLSSEKYINYKKLSNKKFDYDAVIVGSDQIWNEWFTLHGEGKVTKSYFLDFLPDSIYRFAYAASFGCNTVSNTYLGNTRSSLSKFEKISVRERSGLNIIKSYNREAELVCDPTLLLTRDDYNNVVNNNVKCNNVFSYIIHNNQEDAIKISNYLKEKNNDLNYSYSPDCSIENWLGNIKNSKYIVTNSFHGIVFCLIFNKEFVPVLIENSGMNDRIITLLDSVGLSNRLITKYNKKEVDSILSIKIDWNEVNLKLEYIRENSLNFLKSCLEIIEVKNESINQQI